MTADLVSKEYSCETCYVRSKINSKMPMMALSITRIPRKIEATSSMMKFWDESLLLGGPLICASFPNWTSFNFTITWLCQLASTATSCSREQIIRNWNLTSFSLNVKMIETKTHENRTYVKASVLLSKKTPCKVDTSVWYIVYIYI